MGGSLVVLTGASGSGKTTLVHAVQSLYPTQYEFLFFDSIGIPSPDVMETFGDGHQPGGAWQRTMTFNWIEHIAKILLSGRSVLFEGQMRIAFIREALAHSGIENSHILLVDCDDITRTNRLTHNRAQPELANEAMLGWSRYLRAEAIAFNCEILTTSAHSLEECVALLVHRLNSHQIHEQNLSGSRRSRVINHGSLGRGWANEFRDRDSTDG
jgi:energy-coupling factor transporter ATP-binding protein EcfA2